MRVARAFDAASANALRQEVLSELSRQPWWWSTPLRALFASGASEKPERAHVSAASATPGSSSSSSLFQEANIRSSFRRRLLVLTVDDPADPARDTPLGALCRQAIRAVVTAHSERCARPDGRALLSPDARLVELTAVVALPGAFAQDPHADIIDDDDEEEEDDDNVSSWGGDAESYPEDSYLGSVEPLETKHARKRIERKNRLEKSIDAFDTRPPMVTTTATLPKNPLPTLLTSWVSLQPIGTSGGATVIFPGTHARGAGLARMAPKSVRQYRGSDLSEEDELFIQLMHGDAVDAANEGYAMAALELTPTEVADNSKRAKERKRRERWWRRLRADTERAGMLGADVSKNARNVENVLRDAQKNFEQDEIKRNDGFGAVDEEDDTTKDTAHTAASGADTVLRPGRSRGFLSSSFDEEETKKSREAPETMTNETAGDVVVMDTKVWHFGSANRSFVPRVLLNVTFQEPSTSRKREKKEDVLGLGGWVQDTDGSSSETAADPETKMEVRRIDGFTYHVHENVLGKYAVRDFQPGGVMY